MPPIARGQTWLFQPLPVSTVPNTGSRPNQSDSGCGGLDEEEYSRWHPSWLCPSLIIIQTFSLLYFNVFSHRSMLFGPRTCGIDKKGLRSTGCTVVMVTTLLLSLSLKEMVKLVKLPHISRTFITAFLSRHMLMDIVYWIK